MFGFQDMRIDDSHIEVFYLYVPGFFLLHGLNKSAHIGGDRCIDQIQTFKLCVGVQTSPILFVSLKLKGNYDDFVVQHFISY